MTSSNAKISITVHHLENSRSQRVLWILEELGLRHGVDYDVKLHKRDTKTQLAPQSLRDIHPLGKAPVLVDRSSGEQVTVVESAAILEYLVAKYGGGRLRPDPSSKEFLRYTFWMHFAEGSAMTPLLLKLIFDKISDPPIPLLAKLAIAPVTKSISYQIRKMLIDPNLKAQQQYMEKELEASSWFAGSEFSAADVMMSFVLEASAARGGLSPSLYPKQNSFLERIHSRPAYIKALEVGGPYRLLM